MKTIKPFQNESEVLSVGNLDVENRTDRITVHGNVDLTRDKEGLENARALKAVLDKIVQALESQQELPDKVAAPREPTEVKNPFA